jgi:hypothetical protein
VRRQDFHRQNTSSPSGNPPDNLSALSQQSGSAPHATRQTRLQICPGDSLARLCRPQTWNQGAARSGAVPLEHRVGLRVHVACSHHPLFPLFACWIRGTTERMNRATRVLRTAVDSRPNPAAMPIAAVTQMPAAVVKPRVSICLVPITMAPAPRNPTPAIKPCNTRVMSAVDAPACWGIRTKSADPMATSICVRPPAFLPCASRSYPSKPPRIAATSRRSVIRVMSVTSVISENSDSTVFHISCHILIVLTVTSCLQVAHPGTSRACLTAGINPWKSRSHQSVVRH